MASPVLADDFSTQPYWTSGLEPFRVSHTSLPAKVEVAVIGGGYAGLSAALTLARAGRDVAIFEAQTIGDGAAARAAGSLGHVPKAQLDALSGLYGADAARAVYREAREAREYVETLIREYQIACGLRSGFRFLAAHSPRAYERLSNNIGTLRETWGEVELVERARQREVIGSDAFFGGIKIPMSATLQPALLQRGLAKAAVDAGAALFQHTRVDGIKQTAKGFDIRLGDAVIEAKDVILATNADTSIDTPAVESLRKRLVPVPAFALATEEVDSRLMAAVLPINGPVSDTYKIINYIAPDTNGTRFVVSARAGRSDGNLRRKAERMFNYFRERFPDLAKVRVEFCWTGRFAVTGDWIPHVGVEGGIHYVLGCCGTGIPMSTYLGHKAAQMIVERKSGLTVFDRPLPKLPYFGFDSLLLPLAVRGYELRDRLLK